MARIRTARTKRSVGVRRRRDAPSGRRIRVVLADSQSLDRSGMVGLLEGQRDFEVVGTTATVQETIERCRSRRPAVLILSLNLPGQGQVAAIPAIREHLPAVRILALSERGESNCLVLNPPARRPLTVKQQLQCASGTDCLVLAASQGAMGTLRRNADPEELFRAIRAVAEDHVWYDSRTTRRLPGFSGGIGKRGAPLSARELEVAALIAEGCSNKEISTSLHISEATVKKHVGHLIGKLSLADRLQVGLFIARHPQILAR